MNERLRRLLCSGVSQRQAARVLKLNRTTVVRKFLFLSRQAGLSLARENLKKPKARAVEFDDMETMEHTKLKPLSITLAVESQTRRILCFHVSEMPSKGRLAKLSVKKYGSRRDLRRNARKKVFEKLRALIHEHAEIKSDQNPHYPADVAKYLPKCTHVTVPGQRGSITGQGELKKISFDPLFSLNHTCAMFRAHVNRLFRRTWCTTKKPKRLIAHLTLYADYHNRRLQ